MQQEISLDLVKTRLKTRDLLEVSFTEGSTSFPTRVAATKTLCRSCFWSYPTALPSDVFDAKTLLDEMYLKVFSDLNSSTAQAVTLTHVPHKKPAWLNGDFAVQVHMVSPHWMVLSLVNESPPFESECLHLPATLLVKLLVVSSRLSQVARPSDARAISPLTAGVKCLASAHPLSDHIHAAFAKEYNFEQLSSHLTREEYRGLLVEQLLQLLNLASACGLPSEVGAELGKFYDWLCSPLNELLHLTRSLILFAVTVPRISLDQSQFDDLLEVYAALRNLSAESNPTISKRLLKQLRFHTYILSCVLPANLRDQLQQLDRGLAVLDSIADAFTSGVSYPPQYHPFH